MNIVGNVYCAFGKYEYFISDKIQQHKIIKWLKTIRIKLSYILLIFETHKTDWWKDNRLNLNCDYKQTAT